jgi:hypothetical protein
LIGTMDIGLLISQADCSAASTSLSLLSEKDQLQQSAESGTFSALLKNVAQSLSDEQLPPFSNADAPIEPASLSEAGDHATGSALSGIVVASLFPVQDLPVAVGPVAGKTEYLEGFTELHIQSTESTPLLPQSLSAGAFSEDRTMRTEPVPVDSPRTEDSSIDSLPPPVLNLDRSGETPARQEIPRATDEPFIRNGRSAPVALPALPPVSLEQPSDNPALSTKPLPASLITDQKPAPVMEDQGIKILFPAVSVNVAIQSLERPSTGMQPLAMAQEQGIQATTLPGQSLLAPVIGEGGGGERNPFGTDAHGAGGGNFFRSGESGVSESGTRGNQSQLFNGQFTSALQAQSSPQGEGSSVVTPAADRLKMAQAFLGEDHSATVASASGKAQTVHVELPSHDSGPLSVRISMTDQMVHTQFTTDRNDLGALLFTRQDQLQQSLAKSGLELGQFQVHIDQRGQQEALPDRQSRRNGEAPEQQQASQDRNQQAQDREQPKPRLSRVLSLFA